MKIDKYNISQPVKSLDQFDEGKSSLCFVLGQYETAPHLYRLVDIFKSDNIKNHRWNPRSGLQLSKLPINKICFSVLEDEDSIHSYHLDDLLKIYGSNQDESWPILQKENNIEKDTISIIDIFARCQKIQFVIDEFSEYSLEDESTSLLLPARIFDLKARHDQLKDIMDDMEKKSISSIKLETKENLEALRKIRRQNNADTMLFHQADSKIKRDEILKITSLWDDVTLLIKTAHSREKYREGLNIEYKKLKQAREELKQKEEDLRKKSMDIYYEMRMMEAHDKNTHHFTMEDLEESLHRLQSNFDNLEHQFLNCYNENEDEDEDNFDEYYDELQGLEAKIKLIADVIKVLKSENKDGIDVKDVHPHILDDISRIAYKRKKDFRERCKEMSLKAISKMAIISNGWMYNEQDEPRYYSETENISPEN